MGPTPFYGAGGEKPLQKADFATKQTNIICRLDGDIINCSTATGIMPLDHVNRFWGRRLTPRNVPRGIHGPRQCSLLRSLVTPTPVTDETTVCCQWRVSTQLQMTASRLQVACLLHRSRVAASCAGNGHLLTAGQSPCRSTAGRRRWYRPWE